MTYCTFLERQHIARHDDRIGHSRSSSYMYDTATRNPKHRSAIDSVASFSTRNGSRGGTSTKYVGGDGIDRYKDDRDHDYEVSKKASKMAKKAVGKPNYNKAGKDDREFDKAERFEVAADAARRHIRRHPQSESAGIFGNIDII